MNRNSEPRLPATATTADLRLALEQERAARQEAEAGKLELEMMPTCVTEVFHSLCRQFRPRVEAKGLSFTSVLSGLMARKEVWAELDPTRLTQVLGNLLANALKFTSEGAVTFTVHAREVTNGCVALDFRIRDTGSGIHAAQHKKLFSPFAQAEVSVNRLHGGTGLGLVVAQQICREMGGGIDFTSAAGEGSEFHVSLVLQSAEPIAEDPAQDELDWSNEVLQRHRWRVLAAEDNLTNQLVLRHLLKEFDLDLTILLISPT
ncbi:ATP-binding protein [Phaeobacter sp. CAU 1743]|uniref:ATP-binding protein n=1 Tax=Phaeobacter sp. CAU 1743 TaxID=3140367 RepID=UPI0023B5B9C4